MYPYYNDILTIEGGQLLARPYFPLIIYLYFNI